MFRYNRKGLDVQTLHNRRVVYTDHSVIIDKELDNLYKLSDIYCTMFNLTNLSSIDKHKISCIKHLEITVV